MKEYLYLCEIQDRYIGMGNILKYMISYMRIYENVKIENNSFSVYGGLFSKILDEKHIYSVSDRKKFEIENVTYTWRLGLKKEEESIQKNISSEFDGHCCGIENFTDKIFIDFNYDEKKLNPKIKEEFIKTFKKLTFTKEVNERVKEYDFDSEKTIGISVRTWNSDHEQNINRAYNFETYEKAIREELLNEKIETIFISYDNDDYKGEYIKLFSEYPKIRILMCEKREGEDKLVNVMAKCILLSKCGTLICNRISTFSELVFWLGECKHKVIPLF
jgi:hypothetical protein